MTALLPAPAARVVLLHAAFPCCGQKSRFTTEAAQYLRKCSRCGAKWRVLRTTSPASEFADRLGVRFDRLEWQRRPSRPSGRMEP
jgi:hypothetical protein